MDTETLSADSLQAAIEKEPRKAELRYLFGAELAQQRNYSEAAAEMFRALELDPALHSCRFQLGLLLLTMAAPDRAREVWAPLEALDSSSALRHFKRGLESLIDDDFAACIGALRTGIELNLSNPALNRDMQLVIGEAQAAIERNAASPSPRQSETAATVRTDFSLYGPDRD